MVLGNSKPSQLLTNMRLLAGQNFTDDALKTFWLNALPPNIRPIIAISEGDLNAAAKQADKTIEMGVGSSINAVSSETTSTSSLEAEIAELCREISRLASSNFNERGRQRSRTSARGRDNSKNREPRSCYYHRNFGENARKCTQPCNYKSNNQPTTPKNAKKLNTTSTSTANEVAHNRTCRLFKTDSISGIEFLIDSGADVSVISSRLLRNFRTLESYRLFAANGTPIATFGTRLMKLNLGLRKEFLWEFVVTDLPRSIIGADFLFHFSLVVDLRHKRLIDPLTNLSSNCTAKEVNCQTVQVLMKNHPLGTLLEEYKELFKPPSFKTKPKSEANVQHEILTTGSRVYATARRFNSEKLKAAKAEFERMLEAGICRPSKSAWASPLHMMKKLSGDWRPCGDYRRLNAVTVHDCYPLPHIHDFAQNFANKRIFTKLDSTKAYFQIPIAPADREKTAIIIPFGLFELNMMPFGLRNAAQTFQRESNLHRPGLRFRLH